MKARQWLKINPRLENVAFQDQGKTQPKVVKIRFPSRTKNPEEFPNTLAVPQEAKRPRCHETARRRTGKKATAGTKVQKEHKWLIALATSSKSKNTCSSIIALPQKINRRSMSCWSKKIKQRSKGMCWTRTYYTLSEQNQMASTCVSEQLLEINGLLISSLVF